MGNLCERKHSWFVNKKLISKWMTRILIWKLKDLLENNYLRIASKTWKSWIFPFAWIFYSVCRNLSSYDMRDFPNMYAKAWGLLQVLHNTFIAIVTTPVAWMPQVVVTLDYGVITTYILLMYNSQGVEDLHLPTILR